MRPAVRDGEGRERGDHGPHADADEEDPILERTEELENALRIHGHKPHGAHEDKDQEHGCCELELEPASIAPVRVGRPDPEIRVTEREGRGAEPAGGDNGVGVAGRRPRERPVDPPGEADATRFCDISRFLH